MRASRVTVASVAAVLMLSLAACSGNPSSSGSSPEAKDSGAASPGAEASESADGGKSADGSDAAKAKESDKTPVAASGVKKDFATWALPQDEYNKFDLLLQQKGTEVALRTCVAEKGVAVDIPSIPYDEGLATQLNEELKEYTRFTPAYAQAKGYRPPLASEALRPFMEFTGNIFKNPDPNVLINVGECYGGIFEKYPFLVPLPVDEDVASEGAEGQANAEAKTGTNQLMAEAAQAVKLMKTPKVVEAVGKWKECMAPAGIADLPGSPAQMPPQSKQREWYPDPLVNPFAQVASDDEKALASTDAACRESSGYNQALYDTMWDFYVKDVEENKAKYEQRANTMRQRQDETRAFIQQHQ